MSCRAHVVTLDCRSRVVCAGPHHASLLGPGCCCLCGPFFLTRGVKHILWLLNKTEYNFWPQEVTFFFWFEKKSILLRGASQSTVGPGLWLFLSPQPCRTYRERWVRIHIQLPGNNCMIGIFNDNSPVGGKTSRKGKFNVILEQKESVQTGEQTEAAAWRTRITSFVFKCSLVIESAGRMLSVKKRNSLSLGAFQRTRRTRTGTVRLAKWGMWVPSKRFNADVTPTVTQACARHWEHEDKSDLPLVLKELTAMRHKEIGKYRSVDQRPFLSFFLFSPVRLFYLFIYFSFSAMLMAYGNSWTRDQTWAVAVTWVKAVTMPGP